MQAETLPTVSVLVPAFRCAPFIGEALSSLQAQTIREWEAIVVDDGSPDDLAAAMAPFADDARIRLIRTEHGGVSSARNTAFAAARAPMIALLDADDAYEPDYLATMIAALGADPDLGFVTCDARFFGTARLDGTLFSAVMPQTLPITLDRVLRRRFNVFTACSLRATAVRDIGGWAADLPAAEDLDLWLRLLERGWGGALVPRVLHRYRRRADSLSASRLPLLHAVARVYDAAATRLAGRPEHGSALEMRRRIDADLAFEAGEALVIAGDVRGGLAALHRAGARTRTPSWRIALLGMQVLPWAAPAFMRWRRQAAIRD